MHFEIQSTFKLNEIRERIPHLLVELSQDSYRRFFKSRKKTWQISKEELAKMESHTVGYQLYRFLDRHQIDLMPQFESHDVFHLLAAYDTDSAEEIRLQFFLLGNGKRSVFQLGCIILGSILLPEHWPTYILAYQRGKQARRFYNWDFEYLLQEDFEATKELIYKRPKELKLFNHLNF